MERFARLLDRLAFTPQRTGKLALLRAHFADTPDPERGLALAALTGALSFKSVKAGVIRELASQRSDPVLFALSYDFVGDLAETTALIWPVRPGANREPDLAEVIEGLQSATRASAPGLIEAWLDALDPAGRWALLKLVTGGLRVGVSARLAKTALAEFGGVHVHEIEALWHGLSPPYEALFAWLEGRADKPVSAARAPFRPVMLSHGVAPRDLDALAPSDMQAEWKWDGVRVQAVSEAGVRRLYTRTGDDISHAFPDVIAALDFEGALDGELLVRAAGGAPAPFSDLQQRLNRKTVSKAQMTRHPAFIRAYDLLVAGDADLRARSLAERRARLTEFIAPMDPERLDLSEVIAFDSWEALDALRADPPHAHAEGVMIKRLASPYLPGRPRGEWFKWKREPFTIDAVLMYAQRGHGKRSGLYSDFTFGVWRREDGGEALTPVGKAYFGFTDAELKQLDAYVRANATERFGPVRAVRAGPGQGLVLEIAFEGLNRSARHKSGVAMRFPRIKRIRWDKPAAEADRLETLEALLG
ncbi:cisplatin damage response ATP-dependent DNA ligase [Alkalicaulis satelles]|uniref:DNA ligase (ATP) n=1 Tax=Alkalicaulis satelles TaxID=2609175 RepID=A0A5M6ZLC1_9PROT|nr:cisplatin damage response ATP-dependent DNA ligase [Alkalicaulis satelles]KAA5805130.1 cisplatin damage response ATP-dependent DNA ligase [Alkalicaulis satelles]